MASEFHLALDSASPHLAAKLESATDEQRDAVVFQAVKSALESARILNPSTAKALDYLRERKGVPSALASQLQAMATQADRSYAEALAPEDSEEDDSPAADELFTKSEALGAIVFASQGQRALAILAALTAMGLQGESIARLDHML